MIKEMEMAGFGEVAVLDRRPATKESMSRYPLFTPQFLDWMFQEIESELGCHGIFVMHFAAFKGA